MGREYVDEHPFFEADTSVEFVRSHIVAVAAYENLLLAADGEFEFPAHNISGLTVEMLMQIPYGAFLKMYLDDHKLAVIYHNLAFYAFAGRLPWKLFADLKSFASCFHIFIQN
jgi:hypothetical protein